MRISCYSETFIVVNLLCPELVEGLLLYENQQLLGSLGLMASLCLLIVLVTLWERDFLRDLSFFKAKGFRSKLSALKKRLLNQEQEALWGPEGEAFWSDSGEALWAGDVPSFVDIAKRLIKALPASDRPEAYTLLATQLLPEEWPQRPALVAPRPLFETRVKRLANKLQQAPENQGLDLLRADLCLRQIGRLSFDATMLAIARYMHEHPDATPKRKMYWLNFEELALFTAMSIPELEDKASQLWEEIDEWDKSAEKNHSDIWEQYKLRPFSAQLDLESAYSGSFHVAMGNFASFLDAVGAEFNEIRLSNG